MISFSTFWLREPKCTETDLKKSQICPIWRNSDPIWISNLTSLWASDWPLIDVTGGRQISSNLCDGLLRSRDVRFGLQLGQIRQSWDFIKIRFLFIMAHRANINRKLILKSSRFVLFVANLLQIIHVCLDVHFFYNQRWRRKRDFPLSCCFFLFFLFCSFRPESIE